MSSGTICSNECWDGDSLGELINDLKTAFTMERGRWMRLVPWSRQSELFSLLFRLASSVELTICRRHFSFSISHRQQGSLVFVVTFVLDETDELPPRDFKDQVYDILGHLQNSATKSPSVSVLCNNGPSALSDGVHTSPGVPSSWRHAVLTRHSLVRPLPWMLKQATQSSTAMPSSRTKKASSWRMFALCQSTTFRRSSHSTSYSLRWQSLWISRLYIKSDINEKYTTSFWTHWVQRWDFRHHSQLGDQVCSDQSRLKANATLAGHAHSLVEPRACGRSQLAIDVTLSCSWSIAPSGILDATVAWWTAHSLTAAHFPLPAILHPYTARNDSCKCSHTAVISSGGVTGY